jgi:hypothetical protein
MSLVGGGITTLVRIFKERKRLKELQAKKRFARMHSKTRIKFKNKLCKQVDSVAWRCTLWINLLVLKLVSSVQAFFLRMVFKMVRGFLFFFLFCSLSIIFPLIRIFHLVKGFISSLVRYTWGLVKIISFLSFPILCPWILPLVIWHIILMKYGKLVEVKPKAYPNSWSSWIVEVFHKWVTLFNQSVFYGVTFLGLFLSPSFYGMFLVNLFLELFYISLRYIRGNELVSAHSRHGSRGGRSFLAHNNGVELRVSIHWLEAVLRCGGLALAHFSYFRTWGMFPSRRMRPTSQTHGGNSKAKQTKSRVKSVGSSSDLHQSQRRVESVDSPSDFEGGQGVDMEDAPIHSLFDYDIGDRFSLCGAHKRCKINSVHKLHAWLAMANWVPKPRKLFERKFKEEDEEDDT